MKTYTNHYKRPGLRLGLLFCVLAQAGLVAFTASAYDLSADFSLTSNPNGPWSYGAMSSLGGPFTVFTHRQTSFSDNGVQIEYWLLNYNAQPYVEFNGTTSTALANGGQGVYPPGAVEVYPSTGTGLPYYFGVIRFTVPQGHGGTYLLQTSAQNSTVGSLSSDNEFHVLDNGVQIFGMNIPASSGTSFTDTLTLTAGETIDFAVGRGLDGNGNFSGALLTATLTVVPEPSVFGIGLVGLCALALRKIRSAPC